MSFKPPSHSEEQQKSHQQEVKFDLPVIYAREQIPAGGKAKPHDTGQGQPQGFENNGAIMPQQNIQLSKIRIDGGTQPRASLNEDVVADYAEKIGDLPPVTLFFDGSEYWLADGFHRFHAHRKAKRSAITSNVIDGTRRDAVLYSVGANDSHGLRRSNADKRRAVETLLADGEWKEWSDNRIAQCCAVSVPFVGSIRRPEVAEKQKKNRQESTERAVIGLQKNTVGDCSRTTEIAKIEQRQDASKPVEKPEVRGAKPDALYALQAENESLKAELEQMSHDLHEARQVAEELSSDLESYNTVSEGEHATAKELKRLKGLLKTVEGVRNQYMTTASELTKTVKAQQRKIERLEKAVTP